MCYLSIHDMHAARMQDARNARDMRVIVRYLHAGQCEYGPDLLAVNVGRPAAAARRVNEHQQALRSRQACRTEREHTRRVERGGRNTRGERWLMRHRPTG